MTAFKEFVQTLDALQKFLGAKPFIPIPDKVWQPSAKALEKLLVVLEPYYTEPKAPTKADIALIKDHGITAQIKAFIDRDKERKAFFSLDYFEKKCASISDKNFLQALPKSRTRVTFLATFLVYRYWTARPEPLSGLERARAEIEEDFGNSPATQQAKEAKELYGKLLRESDFNRLVALLQARFPEKDAVNAFAKAVSIKIPAGRKPVHERLAAKILKSGELVRAQF